jgi:short-subunit dehydrogenase
MVSPVGQSAYSSSKFAVRGFTEVLRHELAGTNVSVSCVHPGGIRTAIARRARLGANAQPSGKAEGAALFDRVAKTSPETAAARILRGAERREPRILIGLDAHLIDITQRLFPATYWKFMSRQLEKAAKSPT